MLKLKDIFNIDISSKGGSKLYKKIMRKYNIPLKDVKEVKQEIVECSSSGGEGVKEYYYRVDNEIPGEIRGLLVGLLNMVLVSSVLISNTIDDFTTCYKVTNSTNRDGTGASLNAYYTTIRAFSYLDGDTYFTTYGMDKAIKLSGNIFDKFLQYGKEEAEFMLPMIEPYLKEITKEEYKAMITYKP